jgi:putative peptide zinc metalloprotease protein
VAPIGAAQAGATPDAMLTDSISTRAPAASHGDLPRRAAGLELLGRFEGSGFKQQPYLARRSDGQVIRLSPLLYVIAHAADGRRDVETIAAAVSRLLGRRMSGDNVSFLIERKLRPAGVLAALDGSTPPLPKRAPLLALRHRRPLVSERVAGSLGRAFAPWFLPPVIAVVLVVLAAFDAWLFGIHGIAGGLHDALYNPVLLLGLAASVIVATAFHEIGHAAACRYGGARPGVMGVGVYLVWPAFYCDVTDAYRLGRGGRLRVDLGGVYFNAVFALLAGAAYFATGQEGLLLVAVLQHLTIVQQLLPLLRFDGYYVLSDLTGVPDILSRIGPIFRSFVPFRSPEAQVRELKPWVRAVVTAYLAALVPAMLLLLAWIVVGAPRVLATAADSLGLGLDRIDAAVSDGDLPLTALGALHVAALLLPCAATALVLGRTGRVTTRGLARWARGSVPRSAVALAGAAAVVGASAAAWWPDGGYEPIRQGERGTVPEAFDRLVDVPSGWPKSARHRREPVPVLTTPDGADQEPPQPDAEIPAQPNAQRRQEPTPPQPPHPPLGRGVPVEHESDQLPEAGTPAPVPTPGSTPTTPPEPAASGIPTPEATVTPTPTPEPTTTPDPTPTPEPSTTPDGTNPPEATATPQPGNP